ncbi:hypothetical protein EVB78_126 [Rhizobium phage RHph_N1_15]|nr:hypothetical protein EVB77_126 [Rhizobium phage RHph_N1_10]QIG69328.1 hypothetical protein EVB78_126 [Rhizobium phage RHph_N1_15]QIG75188.1 hypothetical protein EVC15_126 [Rhizobium phage RHph_N2_6]
MAWRDRTTADLKHQVERLQWAADHTDDPLWRRQHLKDKETCERILKERQHGLGR